MDLLGLFHLIVLKFWKRMIEDNIHYSRILTDSGISVRKITFGTIQL